tara:strand:- start:54 stop:248 length:195 start_codon:yes stop_codon:yes gene_type:complete
MFLLYYFQHFTNTLFLIRKKTANECKVNKENATKKPWKNKKQVLIINNSKKTGKKFNINFILIE